MINSSMHFVDFEIAG